MNIHPSRQAYVEEDAEVSSASPTHNRSMRQAAVAVARAPSSYAMRMERLKLTDGE